MTGKECIFCKIVAGDAPAEKIWEDEKHVAILDIFPNTEGFTIVLTKEHKPSYAFENDDKTVSELVLATKKVARLLDASYDDLSRSGMFFEGFGVDHLHSKLFPMHGTAGKDKWEMIEKGAGPFYKKYPGFLSSRSSKRMDDERLKNIAEKIRKTKDDKK